jgi:hypothetical protein
MVAFLYWLWSEKNCIVMKSYQFKIKNDFVVYNVIIDMVLFYYRHLITFTPVPWFDHNRTYKL